MGLQRSPGTCAAMAGCWPAWWNISSCCVWTLFEFGVNTLQGTRNHGTHQTGSWEKISPQKCRKRDGICDRSLGQWRHPEILIRTILFWRHKIQNHSQSIQNKDQIWIIESCFRMMPWSTNMNQPSFWKSLGFWAVKNGFPRQHRSNVGSRVESLPRSVPLLRSRSRWQTSKPKSATATSNGTGCSAVPNEIAESATTGCVFFRDWKIYKNNWWTLWLNWRSM